MKRFLIAILAGCAGIAQATENAQSWKFDVFLDDKPIGYHTFDLMQDGTTTVLETEARFDVKFLFVTAFRYEHRNVETWSRGCLRTIDATTDTNGKLLYVSGEERGQGFSVRGSAGDEDLDGCVKTFAYWNPSILQASRLLNSQTGEYEDVSVTFDGVELMDVAGAPVSAERYRLNTNAGELRLWYTKNDRRWIGLDAPAKGDRRIRYRATRIPNAESGQSLRAGAGS